MLGSRVKAFSEKWRLVGFLPLTFFVARLVYFSTHGGISQILWMCHLSNLTLAIGLLFNLSAWVCISAYWFIIALPFWIIDVIGFGLEGLTSAATHAGGTIIALWALFKMYSQKRIWFFALAWYLFLQLICRLFTPPELNINIAHVVYRGWENMFTNYFFYWLLTTVSSGVFLYLLDAIRLFLINKRKKAGHYETSHVV